MSANIVAIRAALEQRLNAMVPALATAWENNAFSPVIGTPYQQVYLLPASPDNPVYGAGWQERGIFQVTLCYPLANGPAAAAARAQLIRDQFLRGLSLTSGGVVVTVDKTPEVGVSATNDTEYRLPVKVRWYANLFN